MDLKSMIVIEVEKNERVFTFLLPVGAPFGEAYDAAFEMLSKIVDMSNEAAENMKRKENEDELAPVEILADDSKKEEVASG